MEKNNFYIELLTQNDTSKNLVKTKNAFIKLMNQYRCAMLEIETKLRVLNMDLSLESESNPFESIHCRLKTPESIAEKLRRKSYPYTLESIEKNLRDVAGIRVICSFPDDIYTLADKLCSQDDVTLLERKDYIANPKPNGYRSLHLILDIPIFLANETKHMPVEVQFRTIAMDFWASLEHDIKYKKEIPEPELLAADLKECADIAYSLDVRMQSLRDRIM